MAEKGFEVLAMPPKAGPPLTPERQAWLEGYSASKSLKSMEERMMELEQSLSRLNQDMKEMNRAAGLLINKILNIDDQLLLKLIKRSKGRR